MHTDNRKPTMLARGVYGPYPFSLPDAEPGTLTMIAIDSHGRCVHWMPMPEPVPDDALVGAMCGILDLLDPA